MPDAVAQAVCALAADAAWVRRGTGVRQLEATLARAVPAADAARLRALSRAGMRSYARSWCDSFRLPGWSRRRLRAAVRVEGLAPLAAALADGRGAVASLGHLAGWDVIGAWAAAELGPVTTAAERLEPPALHEAFVAARARLGVTAVAVGGAGGGGAATFGSLLRALRAGGFVPLLADRDVSGSGVPVQLLGEAATAAPGPAALALATGAPLFPVTTHRERATGAPGGWRLVAVVHPAVAVPARGPGGRAAQVAAMAQACTDALAAGVAAHPEDWHVLQPVFTADAAARARVAAGWGRAGPRAAAGA